MKTRDWIGYEEGRRRDWRAYERFRKEDVRLFLQRAKDVVWSMDTPWEHKANGRPAYPSRAKVLCCLLKVKFKEDYRSLHSYLSMNRDLLKIMELDRAPSKSVLRDAMSRIPQSYLEKVNRRLIKPFKRGALQLIHQASPPRGMRPGSP
ncbi:MAG: hypothetical protein ACE5GD_05820 [Candidatus Geothermarchaeales archaeon]